MYVHQINQSFHNTQKIIIINIQIIYSKLLNQIDQADYLFSLQISTNYTHPDLDYLHQIIYVRQII